MARMGRPPLKYPRSKGLFIRFSNTEYGSLLRALEAEYPVARRQSNLSEWARELLVAHASQVLGVEVTRSALQHQEGGVADWKRWRIAKAVRQAAKRRRKIR
jgi:hypothetical protein